MDVQKVLSDFNNDRQMALSVIGEYITMARLQIDKMDRAIQAEDCEKVWKEAHGLKGGALNLAADGLAKAALQLELAGRSNQFSACSIWLTRFRDELNRLDSFIVNLSSKE
ncbi:MAG TPA: Hpt domain-containing protein [Bacillota bacterium]|nr:Hpt domain-containing protein [Bacillota bacterium]